MLTPTTLDSHVIGKPQTKERMFKDNDKFAGYINQEKHEESDDIFKNK